MILVDVDGVTITRPERDLLRDVSLTIATGERIGIVGINGTGKSTLLRVLAGIEIPESGEVRRGRDTSIAMLDQDPVLPPGTVREAAGQGWEVEAILDRLGMTPLLDARTEDLSGGEAKRVALAKVLVADAELVILDEPTNHLDIGAIHWLEERLATHRGAIVLVSHDRHLLDRVTTRILELDRGIAYLHAGGYGGFLDGRERREDLERKAEDSRRILARQELAWLRRGAPARTRKSKAHIERALTVINDRPDAAARPGDLQLHADMPRLGDKVIEIRGLGHGHDDRWLFRKADLLLGPGDRIGVVGLNGTGKSTLLDIIARRLEPREGTVVTGPTVRLGYHDQLGIELDPEKRVRELITGGKREPDWRDTALMRSFWFDDDTQWSPVRLLSGGERRRLQLVLTLSAQPNVLLLDEPTNDLDLDTLRSLESFLDAWPGTLIVASHDRAFLERTVEDVVVLDGTGRLGRHPGGYGAWEEQQRVRSLGRARSLVATSGGHSGASGAVPSADQKASRSSGKPSGRSVSTIRFDLKAIEKQLARLERRRAEINVSLVDAATDHALLRTLGGELARVEADLAEAEERWLELGAELEDR